MSQAYVRKQSSITNPNKGAGEVGFNFGASKKKTVENVPEMMYEDGTPKKVVSGAAFSQLV